MHEKYGDHRKNKTDPLYGMFEPFPKQEECNSCSENRNHPFPERGNVQHVRLGETFDQEKENSGISEKSEHQVVMRLVPRFGKKLQVTIPEELGTRHGEHAP